VVLGIETSSILCSVAWWEQNKIIQEFNIISSSNHASIISSLVSDGFKKIGRNPRELDLICVTSGPGSFTGLRIGMSYGKGLSYALQKPIISVSNFEILAAQANGHRCPIYTLIDAKRGRVYFGVFKNNNYELNYKSVVKISEIEELIAPGNTIIIHEDLSAYVSDIVHNLDVDVKLCKYSADILCGLAYRKYINGERANLDALEPLYIQPFAGIT
jgi:tRNA threonylcarbamoyladenosine biosynthesis protein TsaB